MTQCQSCQANTQLFLCKRCITDLRDTLIGLVARTETNIRTGETRPAPGWLALLHDAATGDTRLGESTRRSTDLTSPLPYSETASGLLANVTGMLGTWVRHLCESRGIKQP